MKTVPIFFSFDNNYVEPAAVAFYSLLNKASNDVFYDMYVLHSDIAKEKQKLLQDIVTKMKNAQLNFINTGDFLNNIWNEGQFSTGESRSVFTIHTLIRCFAARFFPQYDKIIYSDVDIVVVEDISELYDFDIRDYYIAGVKNPFMKFVPYELSHLKPEHYAMLKDSYVAGGIWLMNLKKIREDNIEDKMFEVINDDTIVKRWNDQDIVNIACGGKIDFIPLNYISYPYMLDLMKSPDFVSHYSREELFDSIINPKIIHYAADKPWNGEPKLARHWWIIFEYLNLEKTQIFKEALGSTKAKIKKYKKWCFLLLAIMLFFVFATIYLLLVLNFMIK